MMEPDYPHWHGMCEVAKHYYFKFPPRAVKGAAKVSPELKKKYEDKIRNLLDTESQHLWRQGFFPEELEKIQQHYKKIVLLFCRIYVFIL